ncbi:MULTISPECIES: hypothetical protein [unclassified Streptomyces]|uniref:hypothetical protein n=1 Tax=unclassified Streptomyces TaxID=2593676 RepID=UPI0037F2EF0A
MTGAIYAATPWTALLGEAQRAPVRPGPWSAPSEPSARPAAAAPGTPRSPASTGA